MEKLLLIQAMSCGDQSIFTTAARLGKDERGIQILALSVQTAPDGVGLLGLDEIEASILEPHSNDVFNVIVVLVLGLVEELALDCSADGLSGTKP